MSSPFPDWSGRFGRREFLNFFATAVAAVGSAGLTRGRDDPKASNAIRLIVRGDDMGFSHSGNEALIKCFREGIETSIEVLAPSPWFPEAARLLQDPANSGVDVGVHLTLSSEWDNVKWRPLTHCPSLMDSDGHFFPMVKPHKDYPGRSVVENKWRLEEIEQEFRAQIALVRRHVPRISHVTSHMGCTGFAPAVSALARRVITECGLHIDLNKHGVKTIRYEGAKGTSDEKLTSFLAALANMKPGGTYLFIEHPGLDTPELRAINHLGYANVATDRQGVTDTWTHPRVKAYVKEQGIQLIGFRDLVRLNP